MKSILTVALGIAFCSAFVGCSSCQRRHYDPTTGLVYGTGYVNSDNGGLFGFLKKDKKREAEVAQAAYTPFGYQTAANCQCFVPQQQQQHCNGKVQHQHAHFGHQNCGCGTAHRTTKCGTCGHQSVGSCNTCATTAMNPVPEISSSAGCDTCANGIVSGEYPMEVQGAVMDGQIIEGEIVDGGIVEGEIINGEPMPAPPVKEDGKTEAEKTDDRAPLPKKEASSAQNIEQLRWIPKRL